MSNVIGDRRQQIRLLVDEALRARFAEEGAGRCRCGCGATTSDGRRFGVSAVVGPDPRARRQHRAVSTLETAEEPEVVLLEAPDRELVEESESRTMPRDATRLAWELGDAGAFDRGW
jgi:hypothetical protein